MPPPSTLSTGWISSSATTPSTGIKNRCTQEIRPILGWHLGPLDVIVNPILDNSYKGFSELDFAPAKRVAYRFNKTWAAAAEQYDDFGAFREFYASTQ
jgi:hypothetical protein